MYATLRRFALISTASGQRRILKSKESVPDFIRKAVEAGVYRSQEEIEAVWKERIEGDDNVYAVMQRFRQDIVRGSNVQDYPVEYLILQQHPPFPKTPQPPRKIGQKMKVKPNPTERLVKMYLNRQELKDEHRGGSWQGDHSDNSMNDNAPPETVEDYYRRLLGVAAPAPPTALGQKSAAVQKAYAAAVKHYQLERTHGLSEQEALQQVDALLAEQERTEQQQSRQRTQEIKDLAANLPQQKFSGVKLRKTIRNHENYQSLRVQSDTSNDETDEAIQDTMQSVFTSNPRAVEGMMRWSDRLAAVPYSEWTVGATTTLDHWIARQVLGLSEETWQMLLEGDEPDLLARGRDVVAVRETLFPETVLDWRPKKTMMKEEEEDKWEKEEGEKLSFATPKTEKREKTIEELLASIGGLGSPSSSDEMSADQEEEETYADEEDFDSGVNDLVDQLQSWRRKNMETPYDKWTDADKKQYSSWMKDYVSTLTSDADKGRVDYDATREALLSQPPVSRDESEAFWSQLQDEGLASVLLESMRKDGPPPGASILHAAFWDLPEEEQLERLLNLGALRPLLDEYTSDETRLDFLQRHGNTLIAGVPLEHLVPDPDGPVRTSDLGSNIAQNLGFPENSRFRLEIMPYQASSGLSAQERTRALFQAWNMHKSGRARYEETLFRTGRLGLRYGDETADEKEEKLYRIKRKD